MPDPTPHFAGTAIRDIATMLNMLCPAYEVGEIHWSHVDGVHWAELCIAGDANIYRIVLAPHDVPIRLLP